MSAKITMAPNGPILVSGEFQLTDSDGKPLTTDKPQVALCRCGASKNKPFCDGSHKAVQFNDKAPAQ